MKYTKHKPLLQVVNSSISTLVSQNAQIPVDDTIPQKTEGYELLTRTITPKRVGSKLLILVSLLGSQSTSTSLVVALFKDDDDNALRAINQQNTTFTLASTIFFTYLHTVTSLDTITFKLRVGTSGAGTETRINGISTGHIFGDSGFTDITILEVAE
jgi:hypothetical protein